MSWQIDTVHSEIHFKIRHMMVCWTHGTFDSFTGTINLDESEPEQSSVDICIKVASINTRNRDRDAHLCAPDFLDALRYPTITFKSTRVTQSGANCAKLTGDLTIRDVAREVTLDVTYSGQEKSPFGPYMMTGFSAETVISRRQWGLTYDMLMESGGVAIGDDIYISIELELDKAIEAEHYEEMPVLAAAGR